MQGFLPSARRAGAGGALRHDDEDVWKSFCQLHIAQARIARRASKC
ncbi:hypothetical protein A2U01_0066122 [Trifolium medium]|uniref:Uncharacterized protein n=1 Tax=Trifolium medium TaxID=97028 RepID=A0A392S7I2_9FABA|nr:hypothetical protein [Trifolium medium]